MVLLLSTLILTLSELNTVSALEQGGKKRENVCLVLDTQGKLQLAPPPPPAIPYGIPFSQGITESAGTMHSLNLTVCRCLC
jgi:hypothetical protein